MICNVNGNRMKILSQFLSDPGGNKNSRWFSFQFSIDRQPPFQAFRRIERKEEHSHLRFMRVTLKAACSSDGAATTTFPPLFSLPSSLSSFLSALRANPTEEYKTITVARVGMKIIASRELRCVSFRLSRHEKHSHGIYFRKYFYFSPPLKPT